MLGLLRRNKGKSKEKTKQAVKRSRDGWLGRVMGILRRPQDEGMWEELEEVLISADVGVATSMGLIERLRTRAREERLSQPDEIMDVLKDDLVAGLETGSRDDVWLEPNGQSSPFVILVVGVNGSGKTTSIGKLAYQFTEAGKKVVLGAADTFRAAAIDQLKLLGERAGAEVISHQPGADPGAVAYDAFQASRARGADVLIIDTAGRLHTRSNLMEELAKVKRVLSRLDPALPHQVILVLDATTGHNGLSQARHFMETVDCTGVFLAKLDGTAKGGIALAIHGELGLPILFVGTGETLQDMAPFDSRDFVDALFEPVAPGDRG